MFFFYFFSQSVYSFSGSFSNGEVDFRVPGGVFFITFFAVLSVFATISSHHYPDSLNGQCEHLSTGDSGETGSVMKMEKNNHTQNVHQVRRNDSRRLWIAKPNATRNNIKKINHRALFGGAKPETDDKPRWIDRRSNKLKKITGPETGLMPSPNTPCRSLRCDGWRPLNGAVARCYQLGKCLIETVL